MSKFVNIDDMKDFLGKVEKDIKDVAKIKTLPEISKREREILFSLRTLQTKALQVHKDLYEACQSQRKAIKSGEVDEPAQEEPPKEPAKKTAKKTTKAKKKK